MTKQLTLGPPEQEPMPGPDGPRAPRPHGPWVVALTMIVLVFTGWMITRGYAPHVGLLTASGAVAVAGGLSYPLKRLARTWGQS